MGALIGISNLCRGKTKSLTCCRFWPSALRLSPMVPVRFASDTPALPSIAEELTDDPSPPISASSGRRLTTDRRRTVYRAADPCREVVSADAAAACGRRQGAAHSKKATARARPTSINYKLCAPERSSQLTLCRREDSNFSSPAPGEKTQA